MSTGSGPAALPPGLRGAIGHRVVVRYRLGEGPLMSDVLGVLSGIEADGTVVVIADRDDAEHRLPPGSVVAGKPVPPRAVRASGRR